jgi:hypothetical protein
VNCFPGVEKTAEWQGGIGKFAARPIALSKLKANLGFASRIKLFS